MPKLTHSDGSTIEVREDQINAYLGQGWSRARALPKRVAEDQIKAEREAAASE